ncbi:hypothetical protein I4641_00705 [Waterburya agarophytonicola K14]|uniref:Uncharacterized protein n=1 Tax=Waterburya agarophytonicola KI4 TaxID=2874699 RepID=A0A964BNY9_9CYAN|nr:hypothetical protein [Waterburya agarophytonicola]MCC0175501.1 hypothetical protein [Waterburya agarophytonicola KI4]
MNNSQKTTTKAIALFLSLGMMSSLAGCEIGGTGGEGGEDGTATEQTTPSQDEGGEGGEGS